MRAENMNVSVNVTTPMAPALLHFTSTLPSLEYCKSLEYMETGRRMRSEYLYYGPNHLYNLAHTYNSPLYKQKHIPSNFPTHTKTLPLSHYILSPRVPATDFLSVEKSF